MAVTSDSPVMTPGLKRPSGAQSSKNQLSFSKENTQGTMEQQNTDPFRMAYFTLLKDNAFNKQQQQVEYF
jgi:hypothetical protein